MPLGQSSGQPLIGCLTRIPQGASSFEKPGCTGTQHNRRPTAPQPFATVAGLLSANFGLSGPSLFPSVTGVKGSAMIAVAEGGHEAARVERRLAAILAADVAGYSRLMG